MKRLVKKADFDNTIAKQIEQILDSLTRQIGKDGNDPVTMLGNTRIEKSYRDSDFFTSRPSEEDDDRPEFTGVDKIKKIIENKFSAYKLLDKVNIQINDDEKSWFTIRVMSK